MGFSPAEVAAMDPALEKDKVALYSMRAPFAGTVIGKFASLSERVSPQMHVVQLADLSKVWVEADVPEADAPFLEGIAGKSLQFRIDGPDPKVWSAKVFAPGDMVDKDTRAIPVRAVADNRGRKLRPGMFVKVELTRGAGDPVVQVPASAIQHHDNRTFVFVPEDNDTFRRVDVTPGRESASMVEISAGLTAGQTVVVEGGFALKSEMLRKLLSE
jgi:cobalt-zinc-cadmium efflux system membrane fusion protein